MYVHAQYTLSFPPLLCYLKLSRTITLVRFVQNVSGIIVKLNQLIETN